MVVQTSKPTSIFDAGQIGTSPATMRNGVILRRSENSITLKRIIFTGKYNAQFAAVAFLRGPNDTRDPLHVLRITEAAHEATRSQPLMEKYGQAMQMLSFSIFQRHPTEHHNIFHFSAKFSNIKGTPFTCVAGSGEYERAYPQEIYGPVFGREKVVIGTAIDSIGIEILAHNTTLISVMSNPSSLYTFGQAMQALTVFNTVFKHAMEKLMPGEKEEKSFVKL